MSESNRNTTWVTNAFDVWEKSLNGETKSVLHQLRKSAMQEFSRIGFPSLKDEEYRFTDVAPIAKTVFKPVLKHEIPNITHEDIKAFLHWGRAAHLLVFVNGHFVSELSELKSLSRGATIVNIGGATSAQTELLTKHLESVAESAQNSFNTLNTAFLQDGLFVHVDDGVALETPIHCLYLATGNVEPVIIQPRNVIITGKHSQVTIIESYASLKDNVYFTNAVTEIVLSENALVDHIKLQQESLNAYHVSTVHVHQQRNSMFTSNAIALGGAIARNNVISKLDGENIECTFNGLSLGTGNQLIDNHTTIDHAKPNCVSHELYKCILDGNARGVFNGKIFVRKDAQKTDAKQTNKTLLLSEQAIIDTKPQLEIFADDVKCTHGATVGQLDGNQIFYLRSRGIGNELARDILTTAFANDVINRIKHDELRVQLEELIFQRLHDGRNRSVVL